MIRQALSKVFPVLSSELFRKMFLPFVITILVFTVCAYFLLVPLIRETVYKMEEQAARNVLQSVYKLIEAEAISIKSHRQAALQSYKKQLKNIVRVQEWYLKSMYDKYKDGLLSEQEAKNEALQELRSLRYGNKDYVWVANSDSVLISHPDPQLHNADFSQVKDVYGNLIVPPMVEVAEEKGQGFTRYWWRRLGKEEPSEKLSFSSYFSQWGWTIGSGVYIDEVKARVAERKKDMIRELRNFLQKTKIAQSGYAFIFDSELNMIIHPNIAGSNFSKMRNPLSGNFIGKDLIRATEKKDPVLHYKWDMPGDKGNYVYDKIAWVRYFPDFDWYVAVSVYEKDLLSPSWQLRNRFFGVMGGGLLVLIALGLIFGRRVLIPVTRLSDMALRVREGDLSVRCALPQKDEIGVLSSTFNTMLDQLSSNIEDLDHKVHERTRELNEKNALLSQEVAERLEVEEKLKESNKHLENILDSTPDAVGIVDSQGRFVKINRAAQEFYGYTLDELLGSTFDRLYADSDELERMLLKLRTYGFVSRYEIDMRRKDGEVLPFEISVSLLRDAQGLNQGSVCVARDLSEIKKTLAELQVANQQLQKLDQMKSDFLSTVSHELRTPLTSIRGFVKIIQKNLEKSIFPLLPEEEPKSRKTLGKIRKNIEIIIQESERLTNLINDVLDISKMEAAKIQWREEEVSVSEVIERAIASTSSLFEDKGVQLFLNEDEDLPYIQGDSERLVQVMINLVSNAVKFTPQGSVSIDVEKKADEIEVRVKDTGVGISEEELSKVFEKFKQVGDTLTGKPQGTGLGLPICKEIIEHHSGRIWAQSKPGQGSTFIFTLPV